MIREITPNDRELFLRLSEEFYSSEAVLHPVPLSYHRSSFEELMRENSLLRCYLFEEDGHPAGYALLSLAYSPEAGGRCIWLEELYVRDGFRGKGLGSAFLRYMEERIPAARFRLEVEEDNTGAMMLYSRFGYKRLPYLQMIRDFPQEGAAD